MSKFVFPVEESIIIEQTHNPMGPMIKKVQTKGLTKKELYALAFAVTGLPAAEAVRRAGELQKFLEEDGKGG